MPEQFTVEYQKDRVNYVTNPSFENNSYNGTLLSSTATVLSSGASLGNYCLMLVATDASALASYVTPNMPIEQNKQYVGSLYMKNIIGANRQMRVCAYQYDSSGALLSVTNGTAQTFTDNFYKRVSVSFTALPLAMTVKLVAEYQVTNAAVNNTAVIDALMLEQSSTLGIYFDGDVNDGYWTGKPYESPSAQNTTNWVALENVQQISGFIGRQSLQDNFEPSRMNISARYPSGFRLQNYSLVVDTQVRVKHTGSSFTMWTGRIRNVTVQYEIPYANTTGVGVADHVDIECEGALAQWGRLQGNNLYVSASDLLTQLSVVLSGTNLQYGTTYTAATAPLLSASSVSDSLANWLNTACATTGSTIKDGSDNNIVGVNGRDFVGDLPVQFSDTTNNSSYQTYDSIIFDSRSSDYFTEIELNTESYGDVVVTTGTAPFRTLRQTTFSASASQATDLANYLLGIYGDNGFGISEISCKSEAQNSWNLDLGYGWWDIIGYTTFVAFRGQLFRCVITGSAFTATPNESRFTYYVADIGLTPFLVLDDTTVGILDTNKLGW